MEAAVDAALDEPVSTWDVEAFLSITAQTRREWTALGRLGSRGTSTVRKYGTTIEYHRHDRARMLEIRDQGLVRVWQAEDGTRGKRRPRGVHVGRAAVPDTDLELVVELTCPAAHSDIGRADEAASAGAAWLDDWIRELTAVDPEGLGPIRELAIAVRSPLAVEVPSKERFSSAVLAELVRIAAKARSGVDRRIASGMGDIVRRIRDGAGYGDYPALFPLARSLGRRLVLHVGPTNSGKTHAAVALARASESSQILSPLRLLALEHFERLSDLSASLVTGEEIRGEHDAPHSARTVEAADMDAVRDVAVVDEVQMLLDDQRGWAWTDAVVGVPARTVIMTGPPECVPLVEDLARMTGEPLEIVRFGRRSELRVEEKPLTLRDVKAGDALIAFSRKAVLQSRLALVRSGRKAAVVYGALGPEVRRREAARFASGECGFLVATDAVGMGLNLGDIRRIVFTATRKFDGTSERNLTSSEIRQIAGRAGRDTSDGTVAVMSGCDSGLIRRAMAEEADELDGPFLVRPSIHAVRLTAQALGEGRLHRILTHLKSHLVAGVKDLALADLSGMLDLAGIVDALPLDVSDKYRLACAAVEERSPEQKADFRRYAEAVARKGRVGRPPASGEDTLWNLEQRVKRLSLYLSTARSFPRVLTDVEAATTERDALSEEIARRLQKDVEVEFERFRGHRRDWYYEDRYDYDEDDED